MTTDVNTLRRAFECLTHFGVVTAGVKFEMSMIVYGYTDYVGAYVAIPSDPADWKCSIPITHLVKLLNTCVSSSLVRLHFLTDHMRVENEVVYRVKYVDEEVELEYPTVQPCKSFLIDLTLLQRFLKMVGDEVRFEDGLVVKGNYQSMVDSQVTFPPHKAPMLPWLGVPLVPGEEWPDARFGSTLLRYLCRTQAFASKGVATVCRNHMVYETERGDLIFRACFTSL